MDLRLNFVFIFASIVTFVFVMYQIRKQGLNIGDAIVWILWSVALMIVSIFPGLAVRLGSLLGFISTSNFVFSVFIFFIYIVVFWQMVEISRLKEKQKELIQRLSIKDYEQREKKKGGSGHE